MDVEVCRFAPSATGRAHPGTLLAGLLAWLDARSRSARFVLRLEDLDPERVRPEWIQGLLDDLRWFGMDWDELELQSANAERHAAALDRLSHLGRLYPCSCSRRQLREHGVVAADGSSVYPGRCRSLTLAGDWRDTQEPLRCRMDDARISIMDESGVDLSQNVLREMGDPVVRRRDGSVAYQLAVVVDDAAVGVTRVVRGRDIAPSTATQVCLQRWLGLPTPVYRHHFLLLEPHGGKLAKLHGSVAAPALREHYRPEELCGLLAAISGLSDGGIVGSPASLLNGFSWDRVQTEDQVLVWTGEALLHWPAPRRAEPDV